MCRDFASIAVNPVWEVVMRLNGYGALVCSLLAVMILSINGPAAEPACPARARPISPFRRPDLRFARKLPPQRPDAAGWFPAASGRWPV